MSAQARSAEAALSILGAHALQRRRISSERQTRPIAWLAPPGV
jgi:hypothetical protein